jgi:hypothetical protein
MFDDIYVMAEGHCLYSGPTGDLTSVFEEAGFQCPTFYNRADFGKCRHISTVHSEVYRPIMPSVFKIFTYNFWVS